MPTQADLVAAGAAARSRQDLLLQTQRATNLVLLQASTTPNATYASDFSRYRSWVTAQDELDDVPLFSRENVDHYFSRMIAYRAGKPDTARKVVSALQWYCNFHYNSTPFTVESTLVLDALRLQKARCESTGNPGGDPHHGLKDIVPESDRATLMKYIYRSRKDWDTASVNFAWGYQGAVRGASNRLLTFSNLNLSYGFGPEKEGSLARALLLVMRKGPLHKDRHDTDKQVCAWRHKNYLLCSVFATAARVIWTLQTLGDSI